MLRTEGNGCVDGGICDAVGPERFADCLVLKDENEALRQTCSLGATVGGCAVPRD